MDTSSMQSRALIAQLCPRSFSLGATLNLEAMLRLQLQQLLLLKEQQRTLLRHGLNP
jgi:hypothetical protein